MRRITERRISELSDRAMREMLQVGAVVLAGTVLESGTMLELGDQPVVITGEITRAQFMFKVKASGMDVQDFAGLTADARFYAISTD